MKAIHKLLQERSTEQIHFYTPDGIEVAQDSPQIKRIMEAFDHAKIYKDITTKEHPNYTDEQIRKDVKEYLESIYGSSPIL